MANRYTVAPCCEPARAAYVYASGFNGSVSIAPNDIDHGGDLHDVKFCPWCGKRFEVRLVDKFA